MVAKARQAARSVGFGPGLEETADLVAEEVELTGLLEDEVDAFDGEGLVVGQPDLDRLCCTVILP